MSKYQPKTQVSDQSVSDFLNTLQDEVQKQDSFVLLDIFKQVTKKEPKMWGSSIVGFGSYHYKGKSRIVKLGKHKIGKSCLYIKKLADVDLEVLKELLTFAWQNAPKSSL